MSKSLYLFSFLIFWAGSLAAQKPLLVQVKEVPLRYAILPQAEVLPDPDSQYQLEDLLQNKDIQNAFVPKEGFDYDSEIETYWLRIHIQADRAPEQAWMLSIHKLIDYAELYYPDAKGNYQKRQAGSYVPLQERERHLIPSNFRDFMHLHLSDRPQTFYLKISSPSLLSRQFRAGERFFELYNPTYFHREFVQARYFQGIFTGILLAMILFNLVIWIFVGDRAYLYFVLAVLTYGLYELSTLGYLYEFLTHPYPFIERVLPVMLGGLSNIFYLIFSQIYLRLKKQAALAYKFYLLIMIVIGLDIILFWITQSKTFNDLLFLTSIISSFVDLGVSIYIYRKGYKPASYYLIAGIFRISGGMAYALLGLKVLPYSFITRYGAQIGEACRTVLFAIGLSARINTMRRELAEKELEKERLARQQEEEKKRFLEQQKIVLENQVKERTLDLQEANEELNQRNEEIAAQRDAIEEEKGKSDSLLLNILPYETAQELKEKGTATPQHYELVSVLFTDFKGFTRISEKLSPQQLISELNYCFRAFDVICEKYQIEKIKTIGDAYMAAGGIPVANSHNPIDTVRAGLEMQAFIQKWRAEKIAQGMEPWELRLGIHSGELVAGVVGQNKFAYDIWGDTVNLAARMESSGEIGKVNISGETYARVKDHFEFEYRGKIKAKNKGEVDMYFVLGEKNPKPS